MEKSNKYLYIILIVLGILVIGGIASATFQEQETPLHLNSKDVTISSNETEYTITGNTEVNASVYLSASSLSLSNVSVNVDSQGNFKYKVNIPQNVTDVNVIISSISVGKLESQSEIHLQRPSTHLSLDSVNFTDNDTYLTVSGVTDPKAQITISSSSLNIENINLVADSEGKFKYQLTIPNDKNSFNIQVKSQALGKKIVSDSLSITRKLTPTPKPVSESNVESNTSSYSSDEVDTTSSQQVIVTRYGEKYHMYKHGNMKHISYISLSSAKNSYQPCKVCC